MSHTSSEVVVFVRIHNSFVLHGFVIVSILDLTNAVEVRKILRVDVRVLV